MNRRTLLGCLGTLAVGLSTGSAGEALKKTPKPSGTRVYFGDANSRLGVIDEKMHVTYYDFANEPFNLWGLAGVSLDRSGALLLTDTTHQRIYRLPSLRNSGAHTSFAFPHNRTEMSPIKIAVDAKGRIYILDLTLKVHRFDDMGGKNIVTLDLNRFRGGKAFTEPKGLRLDGKGRIYITDYNGCFVARFDDIKSTDYTRLELDYSPKGIAFDSQGRIYVTDVASKAIVRYDDMHGAGKTRSAEGLNAKIQEPEWLAIDPHNRIWVSDGRQRIVRVDNFEGANPNSVMTRLRARSTISDLYVG